MALVSSIDRTTYQKAVVCAPKLINGKWQYYGWHPRKSNPLPDRIIVHTTNGKKGSRFESECNFLLHSTAVGAHYLVAKDGRVVRLLDPRTGVAWHAGACIAGWTNNTAIGIEVHFTPGEAIDPRQMDACSNLILDICAVYPIGRLTTNMNMHRAVALPGPDIRKHDPSNMTDAQFVTWRLSLAMRRQALGI